MNLSKCLIVKENKCNITIFILDYKSEERKNDKIMLPIVVIYSILARHQEKSARFPTPGNPRNVMFHVHILISHFIPFGKSDGTYSFLVQLLSLFLFWFQ